MEELNLVPIYRNGMEEISDGIDILVPQFCQGKCSRDEKCKEHYIQMENAEEGLYICPFGFASYVFKIEEDNYIFTCLRIEGKYDKKKLLPKLHNEKKYREISYEQLLKYVQIYKEYLCKECQYDKYRIFVEDIFHDIRKFNQQIKIKNDRIYNKSLQNQRFAQIRELSQNIQAMSWFMTLRLNNHDFIYNETLMRADIKTSYNMFKIIDKVRHCIKYKADEKGITLKLSASQSCRDVDAYDCVELLPYIFLDNAIKYSPVNEKVFIEIEETGSQQRILIKSLGPKVEIEENPLLVKQGYRGKSAQEITGDGMGIGLYTAKCICDLNSIKMELKSNQEINKKVKNIEFSEFIVELTMQV